MSSPFDFDRRLSDWLDDQAPMREPDGLTYAVLARTRRTRQVPGWASLERWIPMTVITRPALSPPLRLAWLLLIGLLMVAVVASVAIVGSRLLTSTRTDSGLPATALIPQGDEAVFALATQAGDIYTMHADGTDLRQLTQGPANDSRPVWSPDGTRIAYHQWLSPSDSLVVIEADGTRTTLASNEYGDQYCIRNQWSTAWSPDGSSLIFPIRDGCAGGFDLSIVAADGSSPPVRLLAPGLNSLNAAWSPDGTRLAYLASDGDGNLSLYVADVTPAEGLEGNVQGRVIAPDLAPDLPAMVLEDWVNVPVWSPDGTEIAVAAVPTSSFVIDSQDIRIVRADGSGQRLLVERGFNQQWSPDGTQVAFHRTVDPSEYWNDRPCTVRTFIIDTDGTDERRLDDLGDGCETRPLWSPDGTRLANMLIAATPEQPALDFHLGIVMVDGSQPPLIFEDGFGTWQPVVAPLPRAASSPGALPTP